MFDAVHYACVRWHGKRRMKQRAGLILDFEMSELIRNRIGKALRAEGRQTNLCRLLEGDAVGRATWRIALGEKMVELVYDYDSDLVVTVKDVKTRKRRRRQQWRERDF